MTGVRRLGRLVESDLNDAVGEENDHRKMVAAKYGIFLGRAEKKK